MTDERRIVRVDGNSGSRRIVVENGTKEITVYGAERRSIVYVRGGTTGSGSSNVIAGYPVSIIDPTVNDVLSFTGAGFTNRKQIELTDGGNF